MQVNRNVKFFEKRKWNWAGDVDSVARNCVPFDDENEGDVADQGALSPCDIPDGQLVTSQDHDNSRPSLPINTTEDDDPPSRYRSLTDIYDECSFALTAADPTSFVDAAKDEG